MLRRIAKYTQWPVSWSSIRPFSSSENSGPQLNLPSAAYARPPRSLIAVSGYDSNKFLNGLITIRPPEPTGKEIPGTGIGAYGAMSNAKGRIITDLFIYPAHDNSAIQEASGANGESCFVLEVDSAISEKVMDILDFHVSMMDVKLQSLDEKFTTFSMWNDEADIDLSQFSENLWTPDTRAPGFGVRAIRPISEQPEGIPETSLDEYRLRRYLFGIPEGSAELTPSKALPLESCIDYMGGIDFNKGCYLGQELTIRTHHHGMVRKRIMPIVSTRTPDEELPEELYKPVNLGIEDNAPIQDASPVPKTEQIEPIFASSPFKSTTETSAKPQRPSGNVIASIGNVGLAKLRVDTLGHDFRIGDLYVKPMIPFWWPQQSE